MTLEPDERIGYRPRFWTLIVLMIVAAPIVVANLSHEERPPVDQAWPPPNAAYGWPLVWYWCEFTPNPSMPGLAVADRMSTHLVEWSLAGLAVNVAAWFIIAAVAAATCEWLLRRYGPRLGYRPRLITFLVLVIGTILIVLSNLSNDALPVPWGARPSKCGWPLIWRWRDAKVWYGASAALDQNYSAGRLLANLALWLLMLVSAGAACEWLLRRYEPRFRWSLRTMLAVVAVLAALCAWCVKLRTRADVQDPIISLANQGAASGLSLHVEHRGPKWLDLVGAERFRRCIVGVDMNGADEELLSRIAPLRNLRYMKIEIANPTPGFAAVLSELSQLAVLRIQEKSYTNRLAWSDCLAAIEKLQQLEELHLGGLRNSGDLKHLAALENLESLSIEFRWDEEDEPNVNDTSGETSILAHLPALPRLEALDLRFFQYELEDHDIRQLARQPRLRMLNLSDIDVADAGLAELKSLYSLQELAIADNTLTATALRSLLDLDHLRALHLQRFRPVSKDTLAALPSQDSLLERQADGDWMSGGESDLCWVLELLGAEHGSSGDKSDRLTTVELDHGERF
ncbi:MAG TPA: hypothetical protein VFI31_02985, partial [Pirellulales bacterium]|nr:hypothetical protein [Pirellulales bacterium]